MSLSCCRAACPQAAVNIRENSGRRGGVRVPVERRETNALGVHPALQNLKELAVEVRLIMQSFFLALYVADANYSIIFAAVPVAKIILNHNFPRRVRGKLYFSDYAVCEPCECAE